MLTPRENLTLFGHQTARNEFLAAVHSARFAHAWIVGGPHGIGKATFCFHMARYLLSGRQDGDTAFKDTDSLYRRTVAGSHGDLWTIAGEDGKEIGVDVIRGLNTALNYTPAEGGWRVVIIDGADLMNRNAANALLKRLEEPPLKTVFFLITAFPGRLLPTLRSRCQVMALASLSEEDVKQVLVSQGLFVPEFLAYGEGSPGRLMGLMEGEGAQLYIELQGVLKGEPSTAFVHRYGGDDRFFRLIEDLLRHFVHGHLLAKAEGKPSFFIKESLDVTLKVWEKIEELFKQCHVGQLDRKATLTCAFATLENRN